VWEGEEGSRGGGCQGRCSGLIERKKGACGIYFMDEGGEVVGDGDF